MPSLLPIQHRQLMPSLLRTRQLWLVRNLRRILQKRLPKQKNVLVNSEVAATD